MGDVAAARGNWRPLAMNSNTNQRGGDILAEQRRQMAEVERLRSAEAASGGYQNRNSRSQSVLPPSGASRPTNHLEVNKMAQVCMYRAFATSENLKKSRQKKNREIK